MTVGVCIRAVGIRGREEGVGILFMYEERRYPNGPREVLIFILLQVGFGAIITSGLWIPWLWHQIF